MTPLTCVLFDLDDVLVHYDHAIRVHTLAARCGRAPQDVDAALFGSGLERDADLGRYDAQGQADELSRRLGSPVTLADCIAARAASMTADPAMVALANAVSRRVAVAILTNNGLLVRDHMASLCPPLLPTFDGRVFCSAEFGVAKPEPDIFRRCLARLDATPDAVLFIDDKATNADGARGAGLHAHHFRGVDPLRSLLADFNLLETDDVAT